MYGHQIDEFVRRVDFLDDGELRSLGPEDCEFKYGESVFKYGESVFKRNKD